MTFFRKKFPFSRPKFLMTFILVIDQVFLIFRIFTVLNVVYDPFFTRKTTISEKNFLMTPFLKLCSYFRAHPTTLLLKNIGGGADVWAVPPLKFWEDRPPSPPRYPLLVVLALISYRSRSFPAMVALNC